MLSSSACKRALRDRDGHRLSSEPLLADSVMLKGAVRADASETRAAAADNPRGQHSWEYVTANPRFICQSGPCQLRRDAASRGREDFAVEGA